MVDSEYSGGGYQCKYVKIKVVPEDKYDQLETEVYFGFPDKDYLTKRKNKLSNLNIICF